VRKPSKDQADITVHSLDELVEYFIAAGKKGVAVNRYKGLGEMNPDQLWADDDGPDGADAVRRLRGKITRNRPDVPDSAGPIRSNRAASSSRTTRSTSITWTFRAKDFGDWGLKKSPCSDGPTSPGPNDPCTQPNMAIPSQTHPVNIEDEMKRFVHGLRHERNHWTSAARRPRRSEAGAPPRAVLDEDDGLSATRGIASARRSSAR
jgi:hypothetical protein